MAELQEFVSAIFILARNLVILGVKDNKNYQKYEF